ncbi:unnamed protein product, partial [Rotaria socialis]
MIDKELTFHPTCVRVQAIKTLRNNVTERLFTIEVKICEIVADIYCIFEVSNYK